MNIFCCWNSIVSFSFTKIFLIQVFLLFINSDFCLAKEEKKTIAVLEFQDNSLIENQEIQKLKSGLPSLFIYAFSSLHNIQIIDRGKLIKILNEQAFIQSGFVDADSLKKVGKLTGANYVILGSFLIGMNDDIRIDCRIVDSESGEIIKAEEVTGITDDFFDLAQELIQKLIEDLNINLTEEENNEFQESFNGCSFQNMLSYSLALTEIDLGKINNAKIILQNLILDCPVFHVAGLLLEEIKLTEKK